MNPFQLNFYERLDSWVTLRNNVAALPFEEQCITIDEWWQRAPLIAHHLHPDDTHTWPDPWELLSENTYCTVARALGMCYTLHFIGHTQFDMCEASDEYGDDSIIVRCGNFIMNWHPMTVACNKIADFTIKRHINISPLLMKIK